MGWRPPYEGNDKLYVSSNAPKRIKEIQFQPMKAQQIVRISEFQAVSHEMYQLGDAGKTPKVGGILDTRLVSSLFPVTRQCSSLSNYTDVTILRRTGDILKNRDLLNMSSPADGLCGTLRLYRTALTRLSYRILQTLYQNPTEYLQGEPATTSTNGKLLR
jgi:hypothetical protein